jgi:hypothetical protein
MRQQENAAQETHHEAQQNRTNLVERISYLIGPGSWFSSSSGPVS